MPRFVAKFLHGHAATTSLEYALVLTLIAMASLAGFGLLGQNVDQAFDYVTSGVVEVIPASE